MDDLYFLLRRVDIQLVERLVAGQYLAIDLEKHLVEIRVVGKTFIFPCQHAKRDVHVPDWLNCQGSIYFRSNKENCSTHPTFAIPKSFGSTMRSSISLGILSQGLKDEFGMP